mmetsp:Transcript_14860/g.21621  ORF Transcript_14860/g.21621 Transcript_14860/m.21621 type:complete len:250 (-) Transcript_14860:12-761(-)
MAEDFKISIFPEHCYNNLYTDLSIYNLPDDFSPLLSTQNSMTSSEGNSSSMPEKQAFETLTQTGSVPSHRGRRRDPETHLFRSFLKQGREVRGRHFKESLVKNVFRGLRAVMKQVLQGKTVRTRFRVLEGMCQHFPESLQRVVDSDVWPRTERPREVPKFSCFNSECVRALLDNCEIRSFYLAFIDELFVDYNISFLIRSFKFRCCSDNSHSYSCIMKWKALKYYLTVVIFQRFGISNLQYPQDHKNYI